MVECTRDNQVDTVTKLLALGGTPRNSLHVAISEGHEEILRLFVERGVPLNGPFAVSDDGDTPLHTAVLSDKARVAKMLLAKGVDVDAFNGRNITPLYLAVRQGSSIVYALLSAGAARSLECGDLGRTALHAAAHTRRPVMVHALLGDQDPSARSLLANMLDSKGYTPLHTTARIGLRQTTRVLLQHGANVNQRTKAGKTPLHLAVCNMCPDVVRVLIEGGADPNIPSYKGVTPLHAIARKAGLTRPHRTSVRIVDALLMAGANEKKLDYDGATPLDVIGSARDQEDVVEILYPDDIEVVTEMLQRAVPNRKWRRRRLFVYMRENHVSDEEQEERGLWTRSGSAYRRSRVGRVAWDGGNGTGVARRKRKETGPWVAALEWTVVEAQEGIFRTIMSYL